MKFAEFETAVIELASEGVRLTTANVVARLGQRPATVEAWLDKMAKDGRLDADIDEEEGVLVYRVKGLSVRQRSGGAASSVAALTRGLDAWESPGRALAAARAAGGPQKKSLVLGALLGLVPGVGLFYAAPITVALVGTAAAAVMFAALKLFSVIPLLGGLLWVVGVGAMALVSALLGVMYTALYNRNGRRTHFARHTDR